MMVLPFLLFFFAVMATITGRRGSAITIWAIGVVISGVLFHFHATDPLHLTF
ncbi:DUF5993 family protein [Burkholderia latens]|uniref:DUF5993 family protein n=1 Tax=Burkholderia latens TaxID=488446 RepID=UPI00158AFFC5|nr:DUF5993 family protein [Burkholderia latens]